MKEEKVRQNEGRVHLLDSLQIKRTDGRTEEQMEKNCSLGPLCYQVNIYSYTGCPIVLAGSTVETYVQGFLEKPTASPACARGGDAEDFQR